MKHTHIYGEPGGIAVLVGDQGAWHPGWRQVPGGEREQTVMLGYWAPHSNAFWSTLQGGMRGSMRTTAFIKQ